MSCLSMSIYCTYNEGEEQNTQGRGKSMMICDVNTTEK